MHDKTQETATKLMELLDSQDEISTTGFELTEYVRGDPTVGDAEVTGAGIELTCYLSFGDSE